MAPGRLTIRLFLRLMFLRKMVNLMMKKIITLALASIICTEAVYPVFPAIVLGVPNAASRRMEKRQYLTSLGVAVNARMTEVKLDELEAALLVAVVAPVAQEMDHDDGADLIAQETGPGKRVLNVMGQSLGRVVDCACSSCSAIKDNPKTASNSVAALCCCFAGLLFWVSSQVPDKAAAYKMCATGAAVCTLGTSFCAKCCLINNQKKD